jgi:ATP-dependent Clp protease ATP-binding subunit ClpA
VLIQGAADCHPVVRSVLAKAMRDGYLTDATGKRIYLSSAIVLIESRRRAGPARRLGFGSNVAGDAAAAPANAPTGADPSAISALLGDELAAEIDLAVTPPQSAGGNCSSGLVANLLRQLAARYLVSGVDLTWDREVERFLAEGSAMLATGRTRERFVEDKIGGVVRPCLAARGQPLKLCVTVRASGLAVDSLGS